MPGGISIDLPDLVTGLQSVSGCLGVETARTSSGKEVIFAWFADKAAVLRWYDSKVHQATMRGAFPDFEPSGPLKLVDDDVGPIMAIASLTMGQPKPGEGGGMPISQISIELYSPLPGGLHFGGRFAPDDLHVEGMRDYTRRVPSRAPKR